MRAASSLRECQEEGETTRSLSGDSRCGLRGSTNGCFVRPHANPEVATAQRTESTGRHPRGCGRSRGC